MRTLGIAGSAAIIVVIVVVVAGFWIYPAAKAPSGTRIQLVVPALGPGVKSGSKVLLRGAEVGEVTEVDTVTAGTVNIALVLQNSVTPLLTDALDVDFRPENYFGVSAVNLVDNAGGKRIADGMVLHRATAPDFTMSSMLERVSLVVDGTLTESMIATLDKIMRYANGLTPLIHSGIILADQVARTQQQLPSVLLERANNMLAELPGFSREAIGALYSIYLSAYNRQPDGTLGVDDDFMDETDEALTLAASDLFGLAGSLLASHDAELTPLVTSIKTMTDPLPGIIGGGATVDKLIAAIDGMESSFSGTEDQRTLQLRVVLDDMPAIAGTLAQFGIAPGVAQGGR